MSIQDNRGAIDDLLGLEDLDVSVGIHEEDNGRGEGITNAEIGSYHEFGYGVPQRSFLRGYFDENQPLIEKRQDEAIQAALDGGDLRVAAELLALELEGGVKERILARIEPDLADSTKKRRGEDAVPLVDTGQLIGSIRGKVT